MNKQNQDDHNQEINMEEAKNSISNLYSCSSTHGGAGYIYGSIAIGCDPVREIICPCGFVVINPPRTTWRTVPAEFRWSWKELRLIKITEEQTIGDWPSWIPRFETRETVVAPMRYWEKNDEFHDKPCPDCVGGRESDLDYKTQGKE